MRAIIFYTLFYHHTHRKHGRPSGDGPAVAAEAVAPQNLGEPGATLRTMTTTAVATVVVVAATAMAAASATVTATASRRQRLVVTVSVAAQQRRQ